MRLFPIVAACDLVVDGVLVLTGSDWRTVALGGLSGLAVAAMLEPRSLVDCVYPRDNGTEAR